MLVQLEANKTYHIYNHANGSEDIFINDENRRFFIETYLKYIDPIVDTYAFCLLKNHFHLLVKIKGGEEIKNNLNLKLNKSFSKVSNFGKADYSNNINYFISKQFANLFSSYTQSFNKVNGRMGSLFMKNFKREEITDENHFRELVVYIHRNPIHHGFCKNYFDWKYSSFHSFFDSSQFNFINTNEVLSYFGNIEDFELKHEEAKMIYSLS